MTLFRVPGHGEVVDLDDAHLPEWGTIARDSGTRAEMWLHEYSPASLAEIRESRPAADDWPDTVLQGIPHRRELVLIGPSGAALAAVVLAAYDCDLPGTPGLLVEIAVHPKHRAQGIGTALALALPKWIETVVPGSHVFADVCTQHKYSEDMLDAAGWKRTRQTECAVDHGAARECDRIATRYCAHPVH